MRGFGIANYRSFSKIGAWLPQISKINVFIGRNNAGKSNILKFLRDLGIYLQGSSNPLNTQELKHWSEGDPPSIDLSVSFRDLEILWQNVQIAPEHYGLLSEGDTWVRIRFEAATGQCGEIDPFVDFRSKAQVYAQLWRRMGIVTNGCPPDPTEIKRQLTLRCANKLLGIIQREFRDVFYVQQFREIRDGEGSTAERQAAGYKLAERLGMMKSPGERRNAEQIQFYQIQNWIRELLDLPDFEIEIEHPGGEKPNAVLLKTNGLRRYLESFGTGIHQLVILCFAISLKKNHIVCIEEPESFLHPTLQRRFLEFLRKTDNTYFLSTHSNVFLDGAKQKDTRIYHVGYDRRCSILTHVETTPDSYRVLEDLGYHASDLLQSNGIIWVEGPTDRLYLLRWLELFGCRAREDLDFTIMYYGGRLLSHLSFGPDLTRDLVPLLRLNRNAIVVLDSERTSKRKQPQKWRKSLVKRIRQELASTPNSLVWVTQGRDIENYISEAALERFAAAKWPNEFKLDFNSYRRLDEIIRHGPNCRRKFNYSTAKVENCREIIQFIQQQDVNVLDLNLRLSRITDLIQSWQPKSTVVQ